MMLFFYSKEDESCEDDGRNENGNIGQSEGGQSPPRKRARKGCPRCSDRDEDTASSVQGRTCKEGSTCSCEDSGRWEGESPHLGFHFPDKGNALPPFAPRRPTGIHFDGPTLRDAMTTEVEFFRLFFNYQMLSKIVAHTNSYAYIKVGTRGYYKAYLKPDGSWNETSNAEIERYIALLIYFGLVKISGDVANYWSTKSVYHGLWARKILSRSRYKALSAFLHVVDPTDETPGHKLRKVDEFLASFKERCKLLYQPTQKLAIDERMVKSKHKSGIMQSMKDKPTKMGLKLWVLADSDNGYTIDFNVYIGKDSEKETSQHGLGYDVVMELMQPFLNQGYHLYFDNFYTSPQLVKDLFLHGTPSTGTVKVNRKDFPKCLLNVEKWAKNAERGDVRWVRNSHVLALQWIDCKPVSILTTLYSANDQVSCKRKAKKRGVHSKLTVPQPLAIHEYNQYMNGVDRSDQMLAYHNVSRKCYRWWKILFFHLVDMAVVNSFLLFQNYRSQKPEVEALQRRANYCLRDFREALVRQILGWQEYDDPPMHNSGVKRTPCESEFAVVHLPVMSERRRNCVVCYREGRGAKKVQTYCSAPQCQRHMHITAGMNCFETWHSHGYERR